MSFKKEKSSDKKRCVHCDEAIAILEMKKVIYVIIFYVPLVFSCAEPEDIPSGQDISETSDIFPVSAGEIKLLWGSLLEEMRGTTEYSSNSKVFFQKNLSTI